ncbi:hypothetical protein D3C85_1600290 [compost metagenome]
MPKAVMLSGMCTGTPCSARRRCRAAIIAPVPARSAPDSSARNSRLRENHMTMMLARMPSTSSAKMVATK